MEKVLLENANWTIDTDGIVKSKGVPIHLKNEAGYLVVFPNGKGRGKKKHRVHRLVARYFIPNPDNKPDVNHIDGNRCNNRVDNLEWVTSEENIEHHINRLVKERITALIETLPDNYPIKELINIL